MPGFRSPTIAGADLDRAVRFREAHGLRSDQAWIEVVAASPEKDMSFETPLTQGEATELLARVTDARQVARVVQAYGEAFRSEWAGVYIDESLGGLVVAQFTGRLAVHREALESLLGTHARWRAASARFSLQALTENKDIVANDLDWLASRQIEFRSLGIRLEANQVVLAVSTTSDTDLSGVSGHYGRPDWLEVEGTIKPAWTDGFGTLQIDARTRQGQPVGDLSIDLTFDRWTPLDRNPGVGTDYSGLTTLKPFPATHVVVTLRDLTSLGWRTRGVGEGTVEANRTTTIKIVVSGQ